MTTTTNILENTAFASEDFSTFQKRFNQACTDEQHTRARSLFHQYYTEQFDAALHSEEAMQQFYKNAQRVSQELRWGVEHMPRPNNYEHKLNQANIKMQCITSEQLTEDIALAMDDDLVALIPWESHNVLEEPRLERFSKYDVLAILIGKNMHNSQSRYRGISQFPLNNYATLTPHERGFLFTMNKEMYLLTGEVAHEILAKGAVQPTFQRLPYTHAGAFPTYSNETVNPDGCTMSFKKLEVIDMHGEVRLFKNIRVSCTHKTYTALVYSVAFTKKLGGKHNHKFQLHAGITETLFGSQDHVIQNALEEELWWIYYFTMFKTKANNEIEGKTEKEIARSFIGTTYQTIRSVHSEADINAETLAAGLIAYEAENARRVADKAQKREEKAQQRKEAPQKRVVPTRTTITNTPAPTQSEDDLEEELTRYLNEQDQ